MYKNKLLIIAFATLLFAQFASGQNNTNSPYTRFGFGDISDTNNGEQRAMGGVSIGSRVNTSINTVNPASYSVVDSMTFQFDLGLAGVASRFSEKNGSTTKFNANLEYITMQFPLSKSLGFSAGVLPYSVVGYNFYTKDTTYINDYLQRDTISYLKSFAGNGGLSQVYMGISAKLFDHISLGVNAYYMFGTINNYRNLTFLNKSNYSSTTQYNTLKANSFRFRFGLQAFNTFEKKHDVTLGLIYEQKTKLNGNFISSTSGVLTDSLPAVTGFETPSMFGLGLHYTYDNRITVGLDYSLQQWKNAQFLGKTDSLNNRSKLALGFEITPNPMGKKYFDHVKIRGGFNISDSYFKIGNQNLPKNFGLSFGLGLPLRNTNTVLNASLEYGKMGTSNLLTEDYLKFTFNINFNERWFFKRKL
jgi:hypothetical protein